MNALSQDERQHLLQGLREMGLASSAELESGPQFRRTFYPIAEHLRAFDPNVMLVLGYHGSGKSMLFKAAIENQLSAGTIKKTLRQDLLLHVLSHSDNQWLAGYPLGSEFPDAGTLRRFVAGLQPAQNIEQALVDIWLAYLARLLQKQNVIGSIFPELSDVASVEIEQIHTAFQNQRQQIIAALDALDAQLKQKDRWVFVNYDELDTLGGIDWELMARLIRGLLTFWSDYMRRWQRLRAKIFLRTDLYANARIFTADFAKLAANRVELTWSDRNLYAMLSKRMANIDDEWQTYCKTAGLSLEQDTELGWIPKISTAEDVKPLIEQVVGVFMGSGVKKGSTFTWILDHLRDGKEQIAPRTLVNLWGKAAAQELDATRATGRQLLTPASIRRALDRVSDDHVTMLKNREMPWLEGLTNRLSSREVPLLRSEFEDLLNLGWNDWRNHEQEKQRPPSNTPGEFLNFLLELGVCRTRPDNRIDVPDLFLHGLSLKRRGGVKR